jgi:hypothetical protein
LAQKERELLWLDRPLEKETCSTELPGHSTRENDSASRCSLSAAEVHYNFVQIMCLGAIHQHVNTTLQVVKKNPH